MNKLLDLRFVIGLFFTVVGLLLLVFSFTSSEGHSINTWCGAVFCIFGVLMIVLSFGKDANDELLDENSKPNPGH